MHPHPTLAADPNIRRFTQSSLDDLAYVAGLRTNIFANTGPSVPRILVVSAEIDSHTRQMKAAFEACGASGSFAKLVDASLG
ncbi:hypothetical protein [Fulvimarina sp. MAC8]|uniref:hypothetical protein n=1 Tax=Fulvimarina sp. MAC8 TaxID=3162874 RepID=UPI0032EBADC4